MKAIAINILQAVRLRICFNFEVANQLLKQVIVSIMLANKFQRVFRNIAIDL